MTSRRALVVAVAALTLNIAASAIYAIVTGGTGLRRQLLIGAIALLVVAAVESWLAGTDPDTRALDRLTRRLHAQVRARTVSQLSTHVPVGMPLLDVLLEPRLGIVRDVALSVSSQAGEPADAIGALVASNNRLLILGEPGSGKSVAAFKLTEHLLNSYAGPTIYVSLSSWDEDLDIHSFLVRHLADRSGYQLNDRHLIVSLLAERPPALVLDGLDEIQDNSARSAFLSALRGYVEAAEPGCPIVLTCRTATYMSIKDSPLGQEYIDPGLAGTWELLPFADQQLDRFLQAAQEVDEDWSALRAKTLAPWQVRIRDALRRPLVASLAIEGGFTPGLAASRSDLRGIDAESLILRAFVRKSLDRLESLESDSSGRYLEWISAFVGGRNRTVWGDSCPSRTLFSPAFLTPKQPPASYRIGAAVLGGLFLIALLREPISAAPGTIFAAVVFYALVTASGVPSAAPASPSWGWYGIDSIRMMALSEWRGARTIGQYGAFIGFCIGVKSAASYVGLATTLSFSVALAIMGGVAGLWIGALISLPLSIVRGLKNQSSPTEASSNGRLARLSARSWLLALAIFAVALVLMAVVAVSATGDVWEPTAIPTVVYLAPVALVFGLILGLDYGGWFIILQLVARHRHYRRGDLPVKLGAFLDTGVAVGLLRRESLGFSFRHETIRSMLEELHLERMRAGSPVQGPIFRHEFDSLNAALVRVVEHPVRRVVIIVTCLAMVPTIKYYADDEIEAFYAGYRDITDDVAAREYVRTGESRSPDDSNETSQEAALLQVDRVLDDLNSQAARLPPIDLTTSDVSSLVDLAGLIERAQSEQVWWESNQWRFFVDIQIIVDVHETASLVTSKSRRAADQEATRLGTSLEDRLRSLLGENGVDYLSVDSASGVWNPSGPDGLSDSSHEAVELFVQVESVYLPSSVPSDGFDT